MNWRILLGLKIVLFIVFLAAGVAKLIGHGHMVHVFEVVGAGQWFRIATGAIEVTAAACLCVQRITGWAAVVMACTMLGAIVAQLARVHESPILAIVLLAIASIVAYASLTRRPPVPNASSSLT